VGGGGGVVCGGGGGGVGGVWVWGGGWVGGLWCGWLVGGGVGCLCMRVEVGVGGKNAKFLSKVGRWRKLERMKS